MSPAPGTAAGRGERRGAAWPGKEGRGGWPARSPFRGGAPPAERGWGQPAWPPGCGMLSARRLPGQSRKVVAPSPPRRVNNVAAAEPGGPPPGAPPFPGTAASSPRAASLQPAAAAGSRRLHWRGEVPVARHLPSPRVIASANSSSSGSLGAGRGEEQVAARGSGCSAALQNSGRDKSRKHSHGGEVAVGGAGLLGGTARGETLWDVPTRQQLPSGQALPGSVRLCPARFSSVQPGSAAGDAGAAILQCSSAARRCCGSGPAAGGQWDPSGARRGTFGEGRRLLTP